MEEAREQDEVAGVHGDGEFDVGRRNVAGGVSGLLQESMRPDVDGTADNHLRQLESGDDHGDEAWRVEFEGAQCVVRVHKGVNTIIHHDEPAS